MLGRVFGKLTVLAIGGWKPSGKHGRRCYYYKVRCSCGIEKTVMGNDLRKGSTKSCGCLRRESHPARNKLPQGEAAFRCCYNVYKSKAKRQKLPFDLTTEQFKSLVRSNCIYCGDPPSNITKHPHHNGNYVYNGIDRVDNRIGYTPINSVPSCKRCNVAKNNMSLTEFLAWIKRVANYAVRSGGGSGGVSG